MGLLDFIKGRYASKPNPSVDTRELSVMGSSYAMPSLLQIQPYADDLIGRKGLKVYDRMRTDDQVKSSLVMKKQARLSLGWKVVPVDDSPEEKKIADFVEFMLQQLPGSFEQKMEEVMTALDYGFSVTEKIYKYVEEGTWKGKVIFADWKTRSPHTIQFETDGYGNLSKNGIRQNNIPLPTDKFIIYTYGKEFDNWYGNSDLRAGYRSWWSKDVIIKFWNIYLERFGQPTIQGKVKDTLSPEQKTTLEGILDSIQTKSSVIVPPWLELALLETTKGTVSYESAVDKHNMMIARSILVPDLVGQTGNAGQGSFALGKKHFDVFLWILNKIGKDLEEVILYDQVITPMITLNFGKREKCPYVRFSPIDEEAGESKAKIIEMGVTAGFIDPNEDWVRAYLGLPAKDVSITLAPKPKAEPSNSPQPKPGYKAGKFRAKTAVEKKINFQRIESEMDSMEGQMKLEASEIVQKQVENLIVRIKSQKIVENTDSRAVDRLEIKYVGDLKKVMSDFLINRYEDGQKDMRGELVGMGIKFAKQPDFRTFTPKEAVDYFTSKAFTWAGTVSDFVLGKVKGELLTGLKNGKSTEDIIFSIQKDLEPFLGTDALDEAALTSQRLEITIRTNFTEAYNEGRKVVAQDPELANDIPAMMYSSIIDDRTTEFCKRYDGLRFLTNDPIWNKITPANHYQCRSIVVAITRFELEEDFKPDTPPNINPAPGFFEADKIKGVCCA